MSRYVNNATYIVVEDAIVPVKYPTDTDSYLKSFNDTMALTEAYNTKHREHLLRSEILLLKSDRLLQELVLKNNNKNPKLTNELRDINKSISEYEKIFNALSTRHTEANKKCEPLTKKLWSLVEFEKKLEREFEEHKKQETSKTLKPESLPRVIEMKGRLLSDGRYEILFLPDKRYETILKASYEVRSEMAKLFYEACDLEEKLKELYKKLQALNESKDNAPATLLHYSLWSEEIHTKPHPLAVTAVTPPKNKPLSS